MESLVDLELTFYFPPNYWFQIFVRLFSFICIAMYVQNYLNYGIKHLTFRDTSTLTTITKAVLYTCSFKRMVLNNLKLSKLCYVSVVFFLNTSCCPSVLLLICNIYKLWTTKFQILTKNVFGWRAFKFHREWGGYEKKFFFKKACFKNFSSIILPGRV